MWHGNTVYFTSDRGDTHKLNLYSYDISSKQVEQLTHFDEFDVMWPSLGPDSIVFENAGYLYTFDIARPAPRGNEPKAIRRCAQAQGRHCRRAL